MATTEKKAKQERFDLQYVRDNANIPILLPLPAGYGSELEDGERPNTHEVVIANGKTYQIRFGEQVNVSWEVYNALKDSAKYANVKILV